MHILLLGLTYHDASKAFDENLDGTEGGNCHCHAYSWCATIPLAVIERSGSLSLPFIIEDLMQEEKNVSDSW